MIVQSSQHLDYQRDATFQGKAYSGLLRIQQSRDLQLTAYLMS